MEGAGESDAPVTARSAADRAAALARLLHLDCTRLLELYVSNSLQQCAVLIETPLFSFIQSRFSWSVVVCCGLTCCCCRRQNNPPQSDNNRQTGTSLPPQAVYIQHIFCLTLHVFPQHTCTVSHWLRIVFLNGFASAHTHTFRRFTLLN